MQIEITKSELLERIRKAASSEDGLDELYRYLEGKYVSDDDYVFPSQEVELFFDFLYATLEEYEYDFDVKPLMYARLSRLLKAIEEGRWSIEDAIHELDLDRFNGLFIQFENKEITKDDFKKQFYISFRFDFDKLMEIHRRSIGC